MKTVEKERFVYEFGKFTLNPQERTLFAEGKPLHLPAKEFETLVLLVENSGRALSKDEMIRAIWQDAFVEEVNLAKQISRLRKIFDSSGEKFIETLPKHGYRFSADLRRTISPVDEPVIVEKRTVKRLTVRVENEFDDAPVALPKPKRVSVTGILIALGWIVFTVASWTWFGQTSKQSVKPDGNSAAFLTDGKFDDNGANWTNDNQIYFSRYVTNTHIETWQMNADGTNQRRANNEIKKLIHGRWSPDGKKVVFRKENDKTIYLADSNGANEIALPFIVGNMDWSPDGSKFVYQAKNSTGTQELFLYTLDTGKNINLTGNAPGADPSFSYDGKQIAFTSWRDGNAEIYVMNADGSNVRRLTNHPAFDNYPVFSPDGTAVAFQSNRENENIAIYLQNLNAAAPPIRIAGADSVTGISPKSWSADGTQILAYTNQNGKDQIFLANVESYPARLILSDETSDLSCPNFAPDGRKLVYQARLADRRVELRLTDLETNRTETIFETQLNLPLSFYLAPAWSPDGGSIAFVNKQDGNSEIYTVKLDGSNLQNLTNNGALDSNPIFSPNGDEIFFVRDYYGTANLYRMNSDGNSQRRVTEKTGYEMSPGFSPDGVHLVFAGDRINADSRGLDIFLLDLNNPNEEKILAARRFHDSSPVFSPDAGKIAFVSTADGNAEIYLMNADGTGLFRLTRNKAEDVAPQFSKDGKRLIFSSNRDGKFAIYAVELP